MAWGGGVSGAWEQLPRNAKTVQDCVNSIRMLREVQRKDRHGTEMQGVEVLEDNEKIHMQQRTGM